MRAVSILGSTGSIGRQTAAVCRHLGIRVTALTTNTNIKLLEEQARFFRPGFVAACDERAARELKIALKDTDIKVGSGLSGLSEAAAAEGAEAVVTAVSGAVGLIPTLAAIDLGRRIALANKETLVCAGELVMRRAKEKNAEIVPVDSEHSAIFQCLNGEERGELARILLTASGGPFRGLTREQTAGVTPEQALKHPNWSMGAKITIDSATMMNKGLEFIEAMHLFSCAPDDIEVLIHPQSIIHSMVEFKDGSVIAQLGMPDMGLPIQYALTWPRRRESEAPKLDFTAVAALTFEKPDPEATPCLRLATDAARTGGTAPAILSAANEEAVQLFLKKIIGYNDIYECVSAALGSIEIVKEPDLDAILAADGFARGFVQKNYGKQQRRIWDTL